MKIEEDKMNKYKLVIFDLELKENRVIAPPFPNMTLLASKIEFSTIRSPLEI